MNLGTLNAGLEGIQTSHDKYEKEVKVAQAALDKMSGTTAASNKTGLFVGIAVGIVAIAAAVGIFCYCKNKNTGEGGDKEVKTLFKTEIKKNNKHQKESLVDTNES